MARLQPFDRAAVRVLRTPLVVEERGELLGQVVLETLAVLPRSPSPRVRPRRAHRTGPRVAVSSAWTPTSRNPVPSTVASRRARPRFPPDRRAASWAATGSAPPATSVSTTKSSASGRNETSWQRESTVSGSSWGRADSSNRKASAGGSSSTFSRTSAAAGIQPVGLADHEHLPSGLGRRSERGVPHLGADRVDVDVAALGLDEELVRVAVLQGKAAVAARAAPAPVA